MESTEQFGLIENTTNTRGRSTLTRDGAKTATELDGRRIEAQYRVDEGHLIIVSDDCPYEEILNIYLLDSELDPLDHIELGAPYSPGLFEALGQPDPRTLVFKFDGGQAYRLVVSIRPRGSLHRLPPGARRPRRWPKHQLTLDRVSTPGEAT